MCKAEVRCEIAKPSRLLVLACVLQLSACVPSHESSTGDLNAAESALAAVPNPPWPSQPILPKLVADRPIKDQLEANDIPRLEEQGFAGDASSASILMRYYGELGESRAQDATKWRAFAAENGDPMAAGLMSYQFQLAGGKENCLRAKVWELRAVELEKSVTVGVTPTHATNLALLAEKWDQCLARGLEGTRK